MLHSTPNSQFRLLSRRHKSEESEESERHRDIEEQNARTECELTELVNIACRLSMVAPLPPLHYTSDTRYFLLFIWLL